MKKCTTIGIFDSGYGGLSVLREALCSLRDADFLYYADTDHVPYGCRSNEEILRFSEDAVGFLWEQGADAVIIACNTASAVSAAALRRRYDFPIIAMEPAVKPALHEDHADRVLVMATPVTLREEKLKNLITREHAQGRIDLLPMPALVEFAEQEVFDGPQVEDYLLAQLAGSDLPHYSAVVLGCTHFNYFKPVLRKVLAERFGAQPHIIEGSRGTVRRAADLLGIPMRGAQTGARKDEIAADGNIGSVRYFVSGRSVTDPAQLERFARLQKRLESEGDCRS